MDLIDRLNAAVEASDKPLKKIAFEAGLDPSKLTRLLKRQIHARVADVEAILSALGQTVQSLYADDTEIDVRLALRTLTQYVDEHEAKPRRVAPKRPASRTPQPFPVAATPNVILFDKGKSSRKRIPDDLWNRGARYAAQVIGDSMIDAGINDGDVVFFRRSTSKLPRRNELVIIRVNTSTYLKRYEESRGEKRLVSDNIAYAPLVIKPGDEVELYGVVVR